MNIFRDGGGRRQQNLNPLTTAVGNYQQAHNVSSQTPSSATTLSSPFTTYSNSGTSANYTPVSSARQYNPQQWGSPNIGSDRMSQFTRPPSEIEGQYCFISRVIILTTDLSCYQQRQHHRPIPRLEAIDQLLEVRKTNPHPQASIFQVIICPPMLQQARLSQCNMEAGPEHHQEMEHSHSLT